MLAAQSGRRGGALQVGAPRGGYEVCARERQPAPVVEPGLSFNMKVLRAKDRLDVPKLQSFHLISSHFCAFLCAESHRSLHARAGLVLANIVPFFGAAVDLLGASVTPISCWLIPLVCYMRRALRVSLGAWKGCAMTTQT